MKLIFLICLLTSCALKKDVEPQPATNIPIADVAEKRDLYCELSQPRYEELGYVHGKCDGLLFTALHAVACPNVSIEKFQKSPGEWKRSPTHDCYPDESRSGLSRDMLLGLMLYSWHYKRFDIIDGLISYGRANSWEMCGGEYEDNNIKLGRCVVTPTLKATMYEIYVKLGGRCDNSCEFARKVPQVWNPKETGFQAHLLQLHILIRWLVQGAINGNQVDQLEFQAKRSPENALFLATKAMAIDGDQLPAWEILKGPQFPADRLPTSQEHCTEYLWQRDPGSDWQPCPDENEVHFGTDFGVVAKIILGELRDKMDLPNLDTLLTTGLGVGGGSLTVGYIAKVLIGRFIKDNDTKHLQAEKSIKHLTSAQSAAYDQISQKLVKLAIDIEVVKSRMGEVMTTKDDVKLNSKDVAIALERIKGNAEDISKGFSSVRQQLHTTRQEILDLRKR